MLEKMFKFKENNTNVKTEVIAGLTTFREHPKVCVNLQTDVR